MGILSFLFFFYLATKSQGSNLHIPRQIHLLRPQSGARSSDVSGLTCLSWRLGVETNNIRGWETVPEECEGYLGHYMLGQQYRKDSEAVANEAILYAQSLTLAGGGHDIWVFDIDETSLSNLPYYAKHGFGVEPFNSTLFNNWVNKGQAPPLPESLKLYKTLLSLGIKAVFITGRPEDQRSVTAKNLKEVGFHTWEKLILKYAMILTFLLRRYFSKPLPGQISKNNVVRGSSYSGKTAVVYKSSERKKLEKKGFRIIGNIGDQWSDLLGTITGNRTFKLPDPLYYIS